MNIRIDSDKAQKNAVALVRMLIRCENVLHDNALDMEDAELTEEVIYKTTVNLEGEVRELLAKVSK